MISESLGGPAAKDFINAIYAEIGKATDTRNVELLKTLYAQLLPETWWSQVSALKPMDKILTLFKIFYAIRIL